MNEKIKNLNNDDLGVKDESGEEEKGKSVPLSYYVKEIKKERRKFTVFLFFVCMLLFCALFLMLFYFKPYFDDMNYVEQNQNILSAIKENNTAIAEMIESQHKEFISEINNQNSLFYDIVAGRLPVEIPEEAERKLTVLLMSVENLKNNLTDDNLKTADVLYNDYVENTAPWIRNYSLYKLQNAKSTIDYYAILNDYAKTSDTDFTVNELLSFILNNPDYKDLQMVLDKYNEVLAVAFEKKNTEISTLKTEIETVLAQKNPAYRDLLALETRSAVYNNDETIAPLLQKLSVCKEETFIRDEIKKELDNLESQMKKSGSDVYSSELFSIFAERLALLNYKAEQLNVIDKSGLSSQISECTRILIDFNKTTENKEEEKIATEIKNQVKVLQGEIQNLNPSDNLVFSSSVQIISSQLASLKISADSLTVPSKKSLLVDIQNLVDKIGSVEKNYRQTEENNNAQMLRQYNKNALERIRRVNEYYNSKKSGEDGLVLLEEIEARYLYPAVSMLYNQVYQQIWNKINSDSQFGVTNRAINLNKKGLNENFN